MKKRILSLCLVAVTMTAASDAFASRARELVLGTGDPFGILSGVDGTGTLTASSPSHGSFIVDDNYNIFYNPSYVTENKNWVTIEKSNGVGTAYNGGNGTPGSKAEGGFVSGFGNLAVGLFFNRDEATPSGATGNTGFGGTTQPNLRPIDLIIGGDAGVKWGVGATYGSYKTATSQTSTDATIRAGVQVADFEPFANVKVGSKDETTNAGVTNNFSGFGGGLRYHYGEWVPYIAYERFKETYPSAVKDSTWGLGFARNTKLGEMTHLNYGVGYWKNNTNGVGNRDIVQIDMSAEADFASWITGRAGFSYRLWDRSNNVSNVDTSSARLGATLHFGKVAFDWAVGGATPATNTSSIDSGAFDIGGGFFSVASMTYSW